ncbi:MULTISPECIES: DUF1871 family protein [Exiguobacterium]|uniref:DUF1871 domain-containing protein n=1 Tax=Exiguobacterium sp. (strain ATCC BAA-1283 / AT1b) TaxID=360911 RepID=C4L4U1_EXISA|nr:MULTISPECIES: DUF1871 family protein [Exiguobacterium]ACQ69686.1 hypothetical protein EAT1b_0755 [Exiguobacterium sp. AT1b]MDX5979974.1 DUF1871 family protein [Exiguobacterium profundum]QLQ21550.1 MAG: DUF1871 family protein [Paracoccaceae bacterium]
MRTEDLLLTWDPLGYGAGSYGPEFDEIMMALTYVDSPEQLTEVIHRTLLEAFDACPPEAEIFEMAQRLLASSSCQL